MLTAGGKQQQGLVLTDGEHEGHQGLGGDVAAVAVWDPLWYLCERGQRTVIHDIKMAKSLSPQIMIQTLP